MLYVDGEDLDQTAWMTGWSGPLLSAYHLKTCFYRVRQSERLQYCSLLHIQSTLIISNSKGLSEILQDIHTLT